MATEVSDQLDQKNIDEPQEENKQINQDEGIQKMQKSYKTCTADDLFNSYVAMSVIIDIRPLKQFLKSHIYESLNIDPLTYYQEVNINPAKTCKNTVIYGSPDLIKNQMNMVEWITMKYKPKTLKIYNNGYDAFYTQYGFICQENNCEAYMYPSVMLCSYPA